MRRSIPAPNPSRAAQMLALAHHVENLIESGKLADYAAAARALGLTRARLSQLMKLLLLAPQIQATVLLDADYVTERCLRSVVRPSEWKAQLDEMRQSTRSVTSPERIEKKRTRKKRRSQ